LGKVWVVQDEKNKLVALVHPNFDKFITLRGHLKKYYPSVPPPNSITYL